MPFMPLRRPPNAGDPIRDPASAWAVVALARSLPPEPETIVVLLDHDRRGHQIMVLHGTPDVDHVLRVVEVVVDVVAEGVPGTADPIGALVVASLRPGRPVELDDVDRWCELVSTCDDAGLVLVEWFVDASCGSVDAETGARVECPRELLGERPRWEYRR